MPQGSKRSDRSPLTVLLRKVHSSLDDYGPAGRKQLQASSKRFGIAPQVAVFRPSAGLRRSEPYVASNLPSFKLEGGDGLIGISDKASLCGHKPLNTRS
jgi:hypothetical protein